MLNWARPNKPGDIKPDVLKILALWSDRRLLALPQQLSEQPALSPSHKTSGTGPLCEDHISGKSYRYILKCAIWMNIFCAMLL
jgi:hypothetical protein